MDTSKISFATKTLSLFGGKVNVSLFGRWQGSAETNWSLRTLDSMASEEAAMRLKGTLRAFTGYNEKILAPRPTEMNGLIAGTGIYRKGARISLEDKHGRKTLYRGENADGAILHAGQSFAMSPADCWTIAMLYTDSKGGEEKLIVAHAARDSLMDPNRFKRGEKERKHFSVVDSIRQVVGENSASTAKVWVGFGISLGKHFAHPSSNELFPVNQVRNDFLKAEYPDDCFYGDPDEGMYDLSEIARHQLLCQGFRQANIWLDRSIDTWRDTEQCDRPEWWSHRRDRTRGRNLLIVNFWERA